MMWLCPIHKALLHKIGDYDAWVHTGCREIFTIIDNHLCILKGKEWIDTKTDECRLVSD